MSKQWRANIERIDIPHAAAEMCLRRCRDFLLACAHDENVLDSLIISCYFQGLWDGVETARTHPEVLTYVEKEP